MAATLEMPVSVAVSVLRNAGTGDNLLAALDALVNVNDTETDVVETQESVEWVNAVNLEDEMKDDVVNEDVVEL